MNIEKYRFLFTCVVGIAGMSLLVACNSTGEKQEKQAGDSVAMCVSEGIPSRAAQAICRETAPGPTRPRAVRPTMLPDYRR